MATPKLEDYEALVQLARQLLDALRPWLKQQPASLVRFAPATTPAVASSFRLSNGVQMPAIGFGTWKLEGEAQDVNMKFFSLIN